MRLEDILTKKEQGVHYSTEAIKEIGYLMFNSKKEAHIIAFTSPTIKDPSKFLNSFMDEDWYILKDNNWSLL